MYPAGGFPASVGSFSIPVAPPGVDPTAGPLVYVGINCAWLPYITGALTQLLLQSTWDVATLAELELVRGQATDLMNLFNCAVLPTLEELCQSAGGGEGDMGCCLRFVDGKLQELVCGVWTDVAGQEGLSLSSPPQPGGGTPQPAPGGGCQAYPGEMSADDIWAIPTPLSTGDVVTITQTGGASNDSTLPTPFWFCPDGQLFFGGGCVGGGGTSVTDPVPTALHQSLIINIGGNYYDLMSGPFTVPAGISNAQASIQVNTDVLSNMHGTLTFTVQVCNNQAEAWTSTLDLTVNSFSDFITGAFAPWTPGAGYPGGVNGGVPNWAQLDITLDSCDITSITMTYDALTPGGTSDVVFYQIGGVGYGTPATTVAGNPEFYAVSDLSAGATFVQAIVSTGTTGGADHIQRLVITGTGPKPSQLP
jgi:hypothetical protein